MLTQLKKDFFHFNVSHLQALRNSAGNSLKALDRTQNISHPVELLAINTTEKNILILKSK